MLDLTPLLRTRFVRIAERTDTWRHDSTSLQKKVLHSLLQRGRNTEYLKKYFGNEVPVDEGEVFEIYSETLPLIEYEDIRPLVIRMIKGEKNILWRGRCTDYAQSSGTSGGKSKYIPVTADSLQGNHYRGGEDAVAHYLRMVPESRLFSGKAFILGGSFSNTLDFEVSGVNVGDLSATLINRINPAANFVRIPDKKTALLSDWETKLPALIEKAAFENVTNISGVPSWFLTVIRKIVERRGAKKISDVWPNLEVFFHGGISFDPYREEYKSLTNPEKMHFLETYNASEGFFGVQNDFDDPSLLLIIDRDVFYEFQSVAEPGSKPIPVWELEQGKVYEMIISSSNGLWRYRTGDTVRIISLNPVKIKIAGRTKSFINAFGEELMEDNAERAIAVAADKTGARILNYTVAPYFASKGKKGFHQWLIEWEAEPQNMNKFVDILDSELRNLNSDYDAKRSHSIFLGAPQIVTAKSGLFDAWLKRDGSHKLGGQRKVTRLHNDREVMERLLHLNAELTV